MSPKESDDDSSGISGKRKKSWRELDAQRGKSKYGSRQDDPKQVQLQNSPTYERYKKAADALFTGEALPEAMAEKFDPENKRKEQKEALLKVTEAPDRKAWVDRSADFVAKYPELPEDAYFLDSLLDHPKERIVDKALAKLEALEADAKLPRAKTPKSLDQRLRALQMTSLDSDVQQRAKALRDKLNAAAL